MPSVRVVSPESLAKMNSLMSVPSRITSEMTRVSVVLVIATIVGLTAYGLAREPAEESTTPAEDGTYDMLQAGRARFEEAMCANCHRIDGEGQRVGPDLSSVGLRLKEGYMRDWITNPARFIPDTMMPPAKLNRQGLNEVVAYLQSLHRLPEE